MKTYSVFLYEDRLEGTGQYVGRTLQTEIQADNETELYKNIRSNYYWARGMSYTEIEESEFYMFRVKPRYYNVLKKKWDTCPYDFFIKARTQNQARACYNALIRGKGCKYQPELGQFDKVCQDGEYRYSEIDEIVRCNMWKNEPTNLIDGTKY